MSGNREKKKRRLRGEALTVLPLYVFTLLFVLGPIVSAFSPGRKPGGCCLNSLCRIIKI